MGTVLGLMLLLVALAAVVVLRSDQRYLLRRGAPLEAARAAGRWDEVRSRAWAHYRSRRPLVRLQRRLQPGAAETQLAVELMGLGDRDEALALSEEAMRRSAGHPTLGPLAASTRALVLTNAERFAEAAALREVLAALAGPASPRMVPVALALLQLGQVDEALALAQAVLAAAPDHDPARIAAATTLAWRGRFDEALGALAHVPATALPGLKDEDRALLERSGDGLAFLERLRTRQQGFFGPARLLTLAEVSLMRGDAAGALPFLDQVRAKGTLSPVVEVFEARLRAWGLALQGKPGGVQAALSRMQALVDAHPGWRKRGEAPAYQAQCAVLLGQPAGRWLAEARARTASPLMRAWLDHWEARGLRAAGDLAGAERLEARVRASGVQAFFVGGDAGG